MLNQHCFMPIDHLIRDIFALLYRQGTAGSERTGVIVPPSSDRFARACGCPPLISAVLPSNRCPVTAARPAAALMLARPRGQSGSPRQPSLKRGRNLAAARSQLVHDFLV